jgi:hypothetical protein
VKIRCPEDVVYTKSTRAVYGGWEADPLHGGVCPSIDPSSTFAQVEPVVLCFLIILNLVQLIELHGGAHKQYQHLKEDQDVHLRVKHVSIRGGEFNIGSAFGAYEHAFEITLHGTKEENGQQYADCWMPGSKMIANAGTLNFYGQKREDSRMSRLTVEAFQVDTEIYVETLLDWVAGDRIALAPTSFKYEASEDKFIKLMKLGLSKR